MKLIATTLARDNALLIGDALASAVDWVDACLVVDTGSADSTPEVAGAVAGPKLIECSFPWVEDFAAARNFALDAACAQGADWAMTLDTDERVDLRGLEIRRALEDASADVLMVMHESGTYAKERFFRLPAQGRFIGPTHEYYSLGGGSRHVLPTVRFTEVPKTREEYCRKFERDVVILTDYAERHAQEPRWFYYLGDALQNLGRYSEALTAYATCAALNGWDEEAAWACYRAAECWIALGDFNEAVARCAAGLAKHAGFPELSWLAAYASWQAQRVTQAVAWAHLSISVGRFRGTGWGIQRSGFRQPFAHYEGPYDVLRFALRAAGDERGAEKAERLYRQASAARFADQG